MIQIKIFKVVVIVVYFLLCVPSFARIDYVQLKEIAENQGYGYKYANLHELKELAKDFNAGRKDTYRVAIPVFAGIPSSKIQDFLLKNGFDMAAKWQALIEKHFSGILERQQVLSSKQYPDAFLVDQQTFEAELNDKFNDIIKNLSNASLDNIFAVTGIDALLSTIKEKNERLMVRSTGKEDTKKLANAGGNESKSNVKPEVSDVMYALRDVVSSYFGQKSLKQRLDAKDPSIFHKKPFTPVLIQRMIGEKDPNNPTKCGVMFTEEVEGGIAGYAERDAEGNVIGDIKTTGITIIQSAYGHNEGVVNSLVTVDTYYLDPAKTIYPIIRPKTHRMVPNPHAERSLILVKNDASMVHLPVLSRDALTSLKDFAHALEQFYNDAMDVEFVVDDAEKTIYIVQARPIVHKQGLARPSYIIDLDAIANDDIISGQAIGVAGGSLRAITNANQIIVAKNIGDALAMYQSKAHTPDPNAIQCVVIGKDAPSTSHEATAFRSAGKPVIFLSSWQTVEQWLKKLHTLFASPQQGSVIRWQGPEKTVEELINDQRAGLGWINYPAPPFVSLSADFAPSFSEQPIDNVIKSMLPANFENIHQESYTRDKLATFLKALRQEPREKAQIALANILLALRFLLKEAHGAEKGTLDAAQRIRIQLMMQYALVFAKQTIPYLDVLPMDKLLYPKRLFPIRFLENVLFQKPHLGEIEDGMMSAVRILRSLSEQRDIRKKYPALKDPTTIKLVRFGNVAMTDELKRSWDSLVIDLMESKDQNTKDDFVNMILSLGDLGAFPIWLHTSFDRAMQSSRPAYDVAQRLIFEFNNEQSFISVLRDKLDIIKLFNVNVFDNPKNFAVHWKTFNDQLLAYFLSDGFKKAFFSAGALGKLIAIGVMTKFVNDVFDLSIKAVTGSQQYTIENQLKNFHAMLKEYYEFLKMVKDSFARTTGDIKALNWDDAILCIDRVLLKNNFNESDLENTSGFSASAFTLGSGTNIRNLNRLIQPKTLEDIFTLIHQDILVILANLSSNVGTKDIKLPPALQKLKSVIENIEWAYLLSINFSQEKIILVYNIPLRTHSGQLEIAYANNSHSISLTARFFGQARARWQIMENFMQKFNLQKKSQVKNIKRSRDGIEFEWIVDESIPENLLFKVLNECMQITYENKPDFKKFLPDITDWLGYKIPKYYDVLLDIDPSKLDITYTKKSPSIFFAIKLFEGANEYWEEVENFMQLFNFKEKSEIKNTKSSKDTIKFEWIVDESIPEGLLLDVLEGCKYITDGLGLTFTESYDSILPKMINWLGYKIVTYKDVNKYIKLVNDPEKKYSIYDSLIHAGLSLDSAEKNDILTLGKNIIINNEVFLKAKNIQSIVSAIEQYIFDPEAADNAYDFVVKIYKKYPKDTRPLIENLLKTKTNNMSKEHIDGLTKLIELPQL